MRFRFCGDLDCPDWVLVQIQNLSKLTSIKLKLLVTEVVRHVSTSDYKFGKAIDLSTAAKFDEGDVRAVSAALEFILTTSAKYIISAEMLSNELQQLGLPKEHATALSKVYSENLQSLITNLRLQSYKETFLESVNCSVLRDIDDGEIKVHMPVIKTELQYVQSGSESSVKTDFLITREKLASLLSDLKYAKQVMESQ